MHSILKLGSRIFAVSSLQRRHCYSSTRYAAALKDCTELSHGKSIHREIAAAGLDRSTFVGNHMLEMYGRLGSVEDAEEMFAKVVEKNVFSWTLMITAYAQNGYCEEALNAFKRMELEGMKPGRIALVRAIGACCELRDIAEGRKLHARAEEEILVSSDVFLSATLVNLYGKCRRIEEAEILFHSMAIKDDFAWNAMMRAYLDRGQCDLSVGVYLEFLLEGRKPNAATAMIAASACAGVEDESRARALGSAIHAQILEAGFGAAAPLVNRVVHLLGQIGRVEEAIATLNRVSPIQDVPWNAAIAALSRRGENRRALELLARAVMEGVRPSSVIVFVQGIDACAELADERLGRAIQRQAAEAGFLEHRDEILASCLINMYGRCGCLGEARRTLDSSGMIANVVASTAMISAYARQGLLADSLEILRRMEQAGTKANAITLIGVLAAIWSPSALAIGRWIHARIEAAAMDHDVTTTNAIIAMYGRCGSATEARRVFDRARRRNGVSWNSIIGASDGAAAVGLLATMDLEGVAATSITLAIVLEACIQLQDLALGRATHRAIAGSALERDANVRTVLLNMYTKCGSVGDAESVFFEGSSCSILQRSPTMASVISWTSMIAAYAQHSRFRECLKQARRMEMEGIKANEVTFLTVLFACSHGGFVEQGCHYFVSMTRERGITASLEQYSCIVDLLARAGWLEEAEAFIGRMDLSPTASTWTALLNACKIHQDQQRAQRVAVKILQLDPGNTSACSLLEDACAEELRPVGL